LIRAFTECVARISWFKEMKVQEYNCATRVCSSYNNVSFYFFLHVNW